MKAGKLQGGFIPIDVNSGASKFSFRGLIHARALVLGYI